MANAKKTTGKAVVSAGTEYTGLLSGVSDLLDAGRRSAARAVNAVLTATYWEVGRRIVAFEQDGKDKAGYGEAVIDRLAEDLGRRFGKGFSRSNLFQIRAFFLGWEIVQTPSGFFQARVKMTADAPSRVSPTTPSSATVPLDPAAITSGTFPLPWSHYVRLLSIESVAARCFYEQEAVRGGWSVRQLARQVNSQFYERTALSKNKAAMLTKGTVPKPEDAVTVEEQIRDPFVLEFLDLQNEYAESDLEAALVRHLETFLLELGGDFTFVGRQKRLRLDDKWFKVDLVFFHRVLRCLVLLDLKIGEFGHADAGQMNMYLNYAKAHWARDGENPPVGLILCAKKGHDEARYALEGLGNKVLTSTYRTTLPDANVLIAEVEKTRRMLEMKAATGAPKRNPK
ncbi:PDDEXK nuclease domain-containing protein [Fimbriiglobus ruber]|uniref:Putative cytoplasmic protein n=1 Tax=Fimbriiglobus ruber TaxID=1908690 RepID=A0A225E558_9BACT|nr:PDDEXK nuclease domain-containing protein [Fimbriiglobus ruber]OWK45236.1 putative cytoplasmic protein [Fimbriiglobus ruber]